MSRHILWTVALLAFGCGDPVEPAPPAGTALSAQNYCEALFEPFCERQIGCNFGLINQATSVETCIEGAKRGCQPELNTWIESLNASRTSFDLESLKRCRREVSEAGCGQLGAGFVPPSCRLIFAGEAEQGGECFTDPECSPGLVCATAGQCPGRCEVPIEDPNAFNCEQSGCASGTFCRAGLCVPTVSEGQACDNTDAACTGDLFCGSVPDEPGAACLSPRSQGAPCEARSHCQTGLSCQLEDDQGVARSCEPGLAVNAACFDTDECGDDLICDGSSGLCTAPRQEEEPCFGIFGCAEGLYCWDEFDPEPLVGVCRENSKVGVGDGEPCNPLVDRCRLGLYCRRGEVFNVGQCAVLPDVGESCADFNQNLNEECRTGTCLFVQGSPLCVVLGEAGDPCSSGEECLSTSCREGECAAFEEVFCSIGG